MGRQVEHDAGKGDRKEAQRGAAHTDVERGHGNASEARVIGDPKPSSSRKRLSRQPISRLQ